MKVVLAINLTEEKKAVLHFRATIKVLGTPHTATLL